MFTRSFYQTPDMIEQHHLLDQVADLVEGDVLHATMTDDFGPINASSLRRAHRRAEGGRTIGKTVLPGFGEGGAWPP